MIEPIPCPTYIGWIDGQKFSETHIRTDAQDRCVLEGGRFGIPSQDHDAFEQEVLLAFPDRFEVSLGSFTLTGDARGLPDAQDCAAEAFIALIELNNKLSKAKGAA